MPRRARDYSWGLPGLSVECRRLIMFSLRTVALVLLIALAAHWLVAAPNRSYACSCAPSGTPTEELSDRLPRGRSEKRVRSPWKSTASPRMRNCDVA